MDRALLRQWVLLRFKNAPPSGPDCKISRWMNASVMGVGISVVTLSQDSKAVFSWRMPADFFLAGNG